MNQKGRNMEINTAAQMRQAIIDHDAAFAALARRVEEIDTKLTGLSSKIDEQDEWQAIDAELAQHDGETQAPEGWVADLHEEILKLASTPARMGTNAGNPRKHSMSDGQFIYLPLNDEDIAKRGTARRHDLTYHDIHRIRKPENAHPRITWLRGPNPNPRAGREDANRTQWVRVEITGPSERRISRAEAFTMFRKAQA